MLRLELRSSSTNSCNTSICFNSNQNDKYKINLMLLTGWLFIVGSDCSCSLCTPEERSVDIVSREGDNVTDGENSCSSESRCVE